MGEPYMTMAEIESKYPNEWVLLDRPTMKRRSLTVTGGHVVLHCADRAQFLRRAVEVEGVTEGAVLFAGKFVDEVDEPLPEEEAVARQ